MLGNAGYCFDAMTANINERALTSEHLSSGLSSDDLALALANAKAAAVGNNYACDLVIGSDQVLVCDGKVFSKVDDLPQAARQLTELQGKTHVLISAVACWHQEQPVFQVSETADMKMYRLTARDIEAYLDDTGPDILSSVGCYQIEGKGIRLFEEIQGSHFTIMGMPLLPLIKFLKTQSGLQ